MNSMNTANIVLRVIYWAITGALVGVGVIAILSIGVFLLAASVPLIIIGAVRGWWRQLWAALVGFGLAPMLILLADLQNRASIQPASTADTYQAMAIVFGAIAGAGLLAGIAIEVGSVARRTRQARVG
jgi:hypothetical protein